MFAFFATLIILSIIITLVQAAFGIVLPGNKTGSQGGSNSCFNNDVHEEEDQFDEELARERFGIHDYGHGQFNENYPYGK